MDAATAKWGQALFSNGAMDAATAKWGLAPFSTCHCEERSDAAISKIEREG